ELSAAYDQLLAGFSVAAGDSAFRRQCALADRMPPAVATTFAAAQRVIDRIHRLGARVRANAHVARAAGFSKRHVDPVEIAELSYRRAALAADAAHLAAGQDDHGVDTFFGSQS